MSHYQHLYKYYIYHHSLCINLRFHHRNNFLDKPEGISCHDNSKRYRKHFYKFDNPEALNYTLYMKDCKLHKSKSNYTNKIREDMIRCIHLCFSFYKILSHLPGFDISYILLSQPQCKNNSLASILHNLKSFELIRRSM